MNLSVWQLPLAAIIVVIPLFALTWAVGRRFRNYGLVDAVWSFTFTPVAGIYVAWGPGWPARRTLLGLFVAAWSLRLGWHLMRRVIFHHPIEDSRYSELRTRWADRADIRMLGFFLLQGVLVVVLSLPFLIAAADSHPAFRSVELAALGLGILSLIGEGLADAQLARSKRDGDLVCQRGLWAWSRHPNYFFEWMVWVAFALFATTAPWGWLAWLAPALMGHFLVNVTGIPLTEELAVRRKGDAYRRYQQSTSAFVPWFGKES